MFDHTIIWHVNNFKYNYIKSVATELFTIKRIHIWKGVSMSNTITLSYTNSFQPICNNQRSKSSNESLRIHCVSVRFNKEEFEILNSNRGNKSKGEWLRLTSLGRLPPVIPSINLEAWKSLSDISQKLNKLINHL